MNKLFPFLVLLTIAVSCSSSPSPRKGELRGIKRIQSYTVKDIPADLSFTFEIPTVAKQFVYYYISSDGIEYIEDNLSFTLWYKPNEKSDWSTIAKEIRLVKPFASMSPKLDVQYFGNHIFAYCYTLKSSEFNDPLTQERKAKAVTELFDAKNQKVLYKTKPYDYSDSPSLVIPNEWRRLYGLECFEEIVD